MELSFLLNSIRRFWWLFAICVIVGALPVGFLTADAAPVYESRAVMLVSPPSESRVQVSFTSDPDRYVLGQLSVLQSQSMAEEVANLLGGGEVSSSVRDSTSVEHDADTDIVQVVVRTDDPERSRAIADGYLTVYFGLLTDQVAETRQPEVDALTTQLASLKSQLSLLDQGIASAMARFLPAGTIADDEIYQPIPPPEAVVPGLLSEKQLVLTEYNQVLLARSQLEQLDISEQLRVTSKVVQSASLPLEPIDSSDTLLIFAGLVAGALVGVVLCGALGRMSRTLIDERQIGDLLGAPIVGHLPHARSLHKNRRAIVESPPSKLVSFAEALAVQAEASADVGQAFTVAVVGAERASGATTVAALLANRYAANGSQVLLIDTDQRDSELTRLFAAGRPGIAALLASRHTGATTGSARSSSHADPLSPTSVPGLCVIGTGSKSSGEGFRRQNVPEVIGNASALSHIVVFDGGPLLESAAVVHLAQLVDAVVLVIPERPLRNRLLGTIAAQLQSRRGDLLPVLVPASGRRAARRGASEVESFVDIDGEPLVDVSSVDGPESVRT